MKKAKKEKMPNDFYMAAAENTKALNDFATAGLSGQQMLLAKLTSLRNAEEKERKLKELTK